MSKVEKMLSLYHMFYEKKVRTIQTSLDRYFFTKKQNTLILNVPNVLNHNLLSKYWLHYFFHFNKVIMDSKRVLNVLITNF